MRAEDRRGAKSKRLPDPRARGEGLVILAIDPGIDTGWALINEEGLLYLAGLGPPGWWGTATFCVIEKPQVYRGRASKGDPNDLITLAITVGRYVEQASGRVPVHLVLPTTWKGQIKKEIHHPRILGALSQAERDLLHSTTKHLAKGKLHNVYDAVGLGKWAHAQGACLRPNVVLASPV